jgi:hypothetical protein
MEAIEMVIYIALAMAAAGLALFLIIGAPLDSYSAYIKDKLLDRSTQGFKHVDDKTFIVELLEFWEDHRHSDKEATLLLYYESEGSISKASLFSQFKRNNLCGTIQSRGFGCGNREDVVMGSIDLPSVVRITYGNEILTITPGKPLTLSNTTYQLDTLRFDGFAGNGNITYRMDPLPPDAQISYVSLEGIFGADFDLYINGQMCDSTFITTLGPDRWEIPCKELLKQDNTFRFIFSTNDLYRQYIAGGLVNVVYRSRRPQPSADRILLPDIDGSINLFTSFDVPQPMKVRMHLNYTLDDLNGTDFFVRIGNSTVYTDSIPGTKVRDIDIPVQSAGMNPLRIGLGANATSVKDIQLPQPVDAVLITDQSGSMDFRVDQDYAASPTVGVQRSCSDPLLLSPDTQKLSLAKCFGKEFIEIILDNYKKNRIGLVSFAESLKSYTNVTSDRFFLERMIDGYDAAGGTCLSCSIQKSTELLQGSDRAKAMVIMTDGCANHIIPGISVGSNACYSAQAFDEAKAKAQEAHDQNISLFTIAFGKMDPAGLQLLQEIACLDNCSNFGYGDNASEIQEIYKSFAERIAKRQAVQTKHVQGSGEEALAASSLHESWLELPRADDQGTVKLLDKIGCYSKPNLPAGIESAEVLSWAGTLWTVSAEIGSDVLFDTSIYGEMINTGDPFSIQLPVSMLRNSIIKVKAADVTTRTECLDSYYLFYSVRPNASNYTFAEGCHWTIDVMGETRELDIPPGYIGDRYCEYTRAGSSYNSSDAYAGSVGSILQEIDAGKDGNLEDDIRQIFVTG